ncbi:glycosyltransferase [Marivita hallyeonensis]|uniref:Glycosyl transferase family 2 n=1 Tax=Marivita hallyeonensis TaxID=996342 RepID=A0A1M5UQK1_9RHOB|nr:glycosyltransferase family 2 protein [Marivita hallyeonensis]SHH65239.1 Glycosyl transferase family 2 [Marivita hallyeonensis]
MQVDVVLIGRNEGDRLVASLASVVPQARRVVYVDSGSTDDSVANARKAGAEVVNLDMSVPFTAARARNAGFEALMALGDAPDAVQFLDGDCVMADGWLAKGSAHITADDTLGLVTGQAAEMRRDATVYNQMFDVEWKRPAGDILACSGNMMVRRTAFREVGGFNPEVIAAEDDEFCTRLRKAGWRLERIAEDMATHDADMTRFAQWWRRAERTGHGFAQVGELHPDYFVRERQRAWIYGVMLPFLAVFGGMVSFVVPFLVLGVYGVSWLRTKRGLRDEGLPEQEAARHAVFLTLSKFPNVIGMVRYHWRRLNKAQMRLIEYK